jgi:hypothetical protein
MSREIAEDVGRCMGWYPPRVPSAWRATYSGFAPNLFNLIPVVPLDGSQGRTQQRSLASPCAKRPDAIPLNGATQNLNGASSHRNREFPHEKYASPEPRPVRKNEPRRNSRPPAISYFAFALAAAAVAEAGGSANVINALPFTTEVPPNSYATYSTPPIS